MTFYQEKLHVESRQNTREFFIIYNELMGKSQKTEQDFFTQNHVENFNNFFASIGKKILSEIEPNNKTKLPPKNSNSFIFSKITKKEIKEVLQKNQHKYCLDCYGLNYKFLKKISDALTTCLEQLFHKIIIKSYFPDALKIVKVVARRMTNMSQQTTGQFPCYRQSGWFLRNWSIIGWYISSIAITYWVKNSSVFRANGAQLMPLLHWWKRFLSYGQTELMFLAALFLT